MRLLRDSLELAPSREGAFSCHPIPVLEWRILDVCFSKILIKIITLYANGRACKNCLYLHWIRRVPVDFGQSRRVGGALGHPEAEPEGRPEQECEGGQRVWMSLSGGHLMGERSLELGAGRRAPILLAVSRLHPSSSRSRQEGIMAAGVDQQLVNYGFLHSRCVVLC